MTEPNRGFPADQTSLSGKALPSRLGPTDRLALAATAVWLICAALLLAGFWGGAINPTIVGPVLLTVLFIGSTVFTESISASKYPAYAAYRKETSMLVPLPRRARRDERALS